MVDKLANAFMVMNLFHSLNLVVCGCVKGILSCSCPKYTWGLTPLHMCLKFQCVTALCNKYADTATLLTFGIEEYNKCVNM